MASSTPTKTSATNSVQDNRSKEQLNNDHRGVTTLANMILIMGNKILLIGNTTLFIGNKILLVGNVILVMGYIILVVIDNILVIAVIDNLMLVTIPFYMTVTKVVGETMSKCEEEADPGVIFVVDSFRLHRCLQILHPPSGTSNIRVQPDCLLMLMQKSRIGIFLTGCTKFMKDSFL